MRAVGPRRDRSRSALDRHDRLEVERTLGLESPRLGQEVVERVDAAKARVGGRAPFSWLEPAQLRLDRRDRRGLRSQLPVERDGADEDARADVIERLAELGRHGRGQLLGVWQHAADRRPELVGRVHGSPQSRSRKSGPIARLLQGRRALSRATRMPYQARCAGCCSRCHRLSRERQPA